VNYVAGVQSQVGPLVSVLRLAEDAPPYFPITEDMVEQVTVPARWSPTNALSSPLDLAGQVPTVSLPSGTVLQQGMLIDPPALEEGQLELAILVDAETGVAGRIGRGSIVDILATFPGSDQVPASANIVIEEAEILEVGIPREATEEEESGFAAGQVVPVTFALSRDETLRLTFIESYATEVRLALRAPTDDRNLDSNQRTYQPVPGALTEPSPAASPTSAPGG
jgi:pilus assembly protein CpaB